MKDIKYEKKLYKILKKIIHECVNEVGLPQKPTIKTLHKANNITTKYEKYIKSIYINNKIK